MITKREKTMQVVLNIAFIVLCAVVIIPFIMVVSISLSSEKDIVEYGYSLIPKKLDWTGYRFVFKNPKTILDAYRVTAIFSVLGTLLSTLLMAMFANLLAKDTSKGKKYVSFFLYFTMLFSGGLVPTYILITQYLHLGNTIWVYIIPSLISPWYVFMLRTFFQGIPGSISESAYMDGASEFTIFFKIIIPLSKPALATVALMTFLGKWNSWNESMLYITKQELMSLQYQLQRIMENVQLMQQMQGSVDQSMLSALGEIPAETARMAMAVVVAGPALVVFPFFQKYFVKGLTVGAVKG